jgi:hypothetical protein
MRLFNREMSKMKINKGQIIAITTGEYSDYCLHGHMKALLDFETKLIARDYLKLNPPTDYDWDAHDKFIAWLISEGFVEPLDESCVIEFYIGSYNRLEIE